MPLGSSENPLVIGLVQDAPDQNLDAQAQTLAQVLKTTSKLAIVARVFSSYPQLLNAMEKGEAHIVFLPPLTYLYASQHGLAEAALLTNHFGVYQYGTQFLANADSGFTIYFDPLSGQNSVGADQALLQFEGKRPCWVDPGSASGYIVAAGLLAENEVTSGAPAFTQSHAAVVRTLYVKGVCDFGATFSLSGDPRTANSVLQDLPDALKRIPIIWRSDAVIPNLNISYLAGLPEETRKGLNAAFLSLAASPDGRTTLGSAAGNYDIQAVKEIDDALYDPLRGYVKALGLDLSNLIGK